MKERLRTLLRGLAVLPLRAYQVALSPLVPPACRFDPSCSQYAIEAIQRHGVVRGAWLGVKRLSRCHPWSEAGIDDVPLTLG